MFIANIGSLFTLSHPATSRLSSTPYLLKLNGATFDVKAAPLRGQRWIRTTEGVSQQIYSLPHLATLVFARPQSRFSAFLNCDAKVRLFF